MLCEIGTSYGFVALWLAMTILGGVIMLILSGSIFYFYYMKPTYYKWIYKNNPNYPSPELVTKEIIHLAKGLIIATVCPAFSLMSSKWGISNGYCGNDNKNALPLIYQGIIIFFFTDLYEYCYHLLGHYYTFLWSIHRHHHKFYNPTPFAVIADEYIDQFVRTLPMVILPCLMHMNIDLLFGIFATLFYGYGVYLHWGYESAYLTAHNKVFNTAYHHYIHHAISAKGRYDLYIQYNLDNILFYFVLNY